MPRKGGYNLKKDKALADMVIPTPICQVAISRKYTVPLVLKKLHYFQSSNSCNTETPLPRFVFSYSVELEVPILNNQSFNSEFTSEKTYSGSQCFQNNFPKNHNEFFTLNMKRFFVYHVFHVCLGTSMVPYRTY